MLNDLDKISSIKIIENGTDVPMLLTTGTITHEISPNSYDYYVQISNYNVIEEWHKTNVRSLQKQLFYEFRDRFSLVSNLNPIHLPAHEKLIIQVVYNKKVKSYSYYGSLYDLDSVLYAILKRIVLLNKHFAPTINAKPFYDNYFNYIVMKNIKFFMIVSKDDIHTICDEMYVYENKTLFYTPYVACDRGGTKINSLNKAMVYFPGCDATNFKTFSEVNIKGETFRILDLGGNKTLFVNKNNLNYFYKFLDEYSINYGTKFNNFLCQNTNVPTKVITRTF